MTRSPKKPSAPDFSGWNNRIIRKKNQDGSWMYGLFETFYDSKNRVEACMVEPLSGWYETPTDLVSSLTLMLADAKKSKKAILDYDRIGGSRKKSASSTKP